MDKKQLEAYAREAANSIETESTRNDFRQILTKVIVERALNAELDEHLGYDRQLKAASENSRNGYSNKTLGSEDGEFGVDAPRDRGLSF